MGRGSNGYEDDVRMGSLGGVELGLKEVEGAAGRALE